MDPNTTRRRAGWLLVILGALIIASQVVSFHPWQLAVCVGLLVGGFGFYLLFTELELED